MSRRVLRKASKAKKRASEYEVTVVFNEPGWAPVEDESGNPRVGKDGKPMLIPDGDLLVARLHELAGPELRTHIRMVDASEVDTSTLPPEVTETPTLYVHGTKEWYKGGEDSVTGMVDWLISKGVEVDMRAMLYGKSKVAEKQPMSEAYEAMEEEMAAGVRRTHMVTQGIKRPVSDSSVMRPRSERPTRGRRPGRPADADNDGYSDPPEEGMTSGVVEVGVHGEKKDRKYKPRPPGQVWKGERQAPVKRLDHMAERAGGKTAGSRMGAAHRLDFHERADKTHGSALHKDALGREPVERTRRTRPRGERPPGDRVVTGPVGYGDEDTVEVDAAAEAAEIKRRMEERMKRNEDARRRTGGRAREEEDESDSGSYYEDEGVEESKA